MNIADNNHRMVNGNWLIRFIFLLAIFYLAAYSSVSPVGPSSIPVHHDDYSNYSLGFDGLSLRIRPLSTFAIAGFASIGSDVLIWAVRIMAVAYVLLCFILFENITHKNNRWFDTVCFSIIIFSSPMVAEYARYTGMATHLISGCLGILAVIFLRQAFTTGRTSLAFMSATCLLLSVMAKEDFLVFYALSYVFFFVVLPKSKKVAWIGIFGLVVSAAAVLSFKLFSGTAFLGVADQNSPYYISIVPSSIVKTVGAYLLGTGHPAMMVHGNIILVFVATALLVSMFIKYQYSSRTLYFICCVFGIMAPYALLPNHVNPYYEYLWYPFVIFAFYSALIGAFASVKMLFLPSIARQYSARILLVALTCLVAFLDYPGRKGVASWYSDVASSNEKVLIKLANMDKTNNEKICVFGADTFSPWYMHSGRYLDRVMGMNNTWQIYLPDGSDKKPGFDIGANSSNGRIIVESEKTFVPGSCEVLDLGSTQHG